jgi:hypothetical protein
MTLPENVEKAVRAALFECSDFLGFAPRAYIEEALTKHLAPAIADLVADRERLDCLERDWSRFVTYWEMATGDGRIRSTIDAFQAEGGSKP